jgi:molecular chaperone HtpG
MPLYGIINDAGVLGIRIRVKNLQLDGSEIVARILQRHAPSYARFASWHLDEIYVEGESAIPNARRDGFEDSAGWRAIEGQIAGALLPLVKNAYEASGKRSSKVFSKVNEDVGREIKEIETALAESDNALSPNRKVIGRNIRGALKRIENLNLDEYTDKQQRALRESTVKLRNLADQASVKIAPSKPRPQPEPEEDEIPYHEFLDVVFEVINPLLDTRTFNKVRKALIERFKDV